MKACEYLNQLKVIDSNINNLILEREGVWALATRTTSSLDANKVQTSNQDQMSDLTIKLIELTNEIDKTTDLLVDKKHLIISQINALMQVNYIDILHKRYVEYKPLTKIAEEINYSYPYVIELHTKALEEFERTYTILYAHVLL